MTKNICACYPIDNNNDNRAFYSILSMIKFEFDSTHFASSKLFYLKEIRIFVLLKYLVKIYKFRNSKTKFRISIFYVCTSQFSFMFFNNLPNY